MSFKNRDRLIYGNRKGWKCELCGRKRSDGYRLEFHHRLPKSAGGSDEIENAELLCIECHYLRHLELEAQGIGHNSANTVLARLISIGLRWDKSKK